MKFLANVFRKISELIENRIEHIDQEPVDIFAEKIHKDFHKEQLDIALRGDNHVKVYQPHWFHLGLYSNLKGSNHADGQKAIPEKLESDRNQN